MKARQKIKTPFGDGCIQNIVKNKKDCNSDGSKNCPARSWGPQILIRPDNKSFLVPIDPDATRGSVDTCEVTMTLTEEEIETLAKRFLYAKAVQNKSKKKKEAEAEQLQQEEPPLRPLLKSGWRYKVGDRLFFKSEWFANKNLGLDAKDRFGVVVRANERQRPKGNRGTYFYRIKFLPENIVLGDPNSRIPRKFIDTDSNVEFQN